MEDMFDLRCELQASKDDSEALARVVTASLREKEVYVKAVERAFKEEDWKTAEELTVRLQFLQKLCEDAKEMGRDTN
jgi:DnaJ-domain-containing protein 1